MVDVLREEFGWIDESMPELISFLKRIVEINSHTFNTEGVCLLLDALEDEFKKLDLNIKRFGKGETGEVLTAKTGASGGDDILLVGHCDTVHPKDGAFQRFWVEEEMAFGPGVLDMKGGLAVILWALKALHRAGRLAELPLTVLVNSDEEVGSEYSREVITENAKNCRAALVFEWGRVNNCIITRRKGMGVYEIKVKGKSAHSGNNHAGGANAIEQLAELVLKIQDLTDYEKGVTCNVGLISGGTAVNSVADFASAQFDLRVPSLKAYEEFNRALDKIRSSAPRVARSEFSIREVVFDPPLVETKESRRLAESYIKAGQPFGLNSKVHPEIMGGGSDANRISSLGVPVIDGLGPFGDCPHSDKEYIVLSSLAPKIKNLAAWLSSARA